ncbi:hypothetical protein AB1K54_12865 [Microbacterium sp. BWT-B31]|uniref:hypothetical protein n=1 Tax=Microbacterium sp. BWT-B31 TaxID=3232072 RepID=UPI003528AD7E
MSDDERVADALPAGVTPAPRPDGEPLRCRTPALDSDSPGYLYTGLWDVPLADGTDVESVVLGIPDRLGDQWEVLVRETDSPVDILIVDPATKVEVNVTDVTAATGAPSIAIGAISHCGQKPDAAQ